MTTNNNMMMSVVTLNKARIMERCPIENRRNRTKYFLHHKFVQIKKDMKINKSRAKGLRTFFWKMKGGEILLHNNIIIIVVLTIQLVCAFSEPTTKENILMELEGLAWKGDKILGCFYSVRLHYNEVECDNETRS